MKVTSCYPYIPVSDLQHSAEWYREYLGFNVVAEDPIYLDLRTDSGVRILLIPNEGEVTSHMHYPSGTQAAYGFTVTDIETVYQRFIDKGIQVGKLFDYQGTSFSFTDPDGNVIELWSDNMK